MGHQFIKQPNGKFAIWSSIVTDFIAFNCTREDVIEIETEDAVKEITARVNDKLDRVERGEQAYFQFTMSWQEALQRRDEQHGKDGRLVDDRGDPVPYFVVEAWVDGGHVGSIEAYWAPGTLANTSSGIEKDWTDWTGDIAMGKRFPTREAAEKEITSIREKKMEWSSNMHVLGVK